MTTPAQDLTVNQLSSYPYRYKRVSDVGWLQGTSQPVSQLSIRKVRPQSVSNPLRSDGSRKPSPWQNQWWFFQPPVGDLRWIQGSTPREYESILPSPAIYNASPLALSKNTWCAGTAPFPQRVWDIAAVRLRNEVMNSKFNLGVALGEARQTVGLVGSSVRRVVGGIDKFCDTWNLNRRQFRQLLRSPRSILNPQFVAELGKKNANKAANAWLEYNYGWKPLVRDTYAASEVLDDYVNGQSMPLSCTTKKGYMEDDEIVFDWGNLINTNTWRMELPCRISTGVHFSVTYYVPDGTLPSFQSLGLTNPAAIAWELVPYSFVVDWFVDIGNWLSALNATNGLFFREGSASLIQKIDSTSDFVPKIVPGNSVTIVKCPTAGVLVSGKFQRQVLSGFPGIPMLPSIKTRLGLPQLASGLSLLVQRTT